MLLPLADNNPLRFIRHAYVNWAAIITCIVVFAYQAALDPRAGAIMAHVYGAIPAVVFGLADLPPDLARLPGWATLVTSMFLHGGLMHLAGNMLFLWVLGDNIEDALGHLRYVAFYLACGVAAALAHAIGEPASEVPMIGASGAISGVIGGYLILHPRAPIKTLIWLFIIKLPAWVVLGIWAAFQFFSAFAATGGVVGGGGVAWWAHVGGLIAGLALIAPMRRKQVALFDRDAPPESPRGPRIGMRPGPWTRRR